MSEGLLVRGGLAEAALEGRVSADRYVETETLQTRAASAFVRAEADARAEALGQILFGEWFEVLQQVDGLAFGRGVRDGCVGWMERAALGPTSTPTHRVVTLRAFAYAEPDLRSPAAGPLALNALASVHTGQGRWLHDPAIGWLAEGDLAPIGQAFETDVAAVALRLLGTPYLHGARDGIGMDAPGLVQQAMYACGLACPRTLEGQRELGRALAGDEAPRRGDLAFWDEQVGVMRDLDHLIIAETGGVIVTALPQAFELRRVT